MAMIAAMAVCLRVAAVLCAAALLAASCSSDDGDARADLDSAPVTTTATTAAPSSSSSSTTTTTTEPTTTTLSELQLAEAEVQRVVEAWFNYPFDSSKGDEGMGVEYLTGIMRARNIEYGASFQAKGQTLVSRKPQRLELEDVSVELERGFASVEACFGSAQELLDSATQEVIYAEDPSYTTTSRFELVMTDDGWKISNWYLSRNTDSPIACEVGE